DGLSGRTFWVWPESLWAPISFTKACLEERGGGSWEDWWCDPDSKVYQFIGEDCIYFYGPAEMSLFMGTHTGGPSTDPIKGKLRLPEVIANRYLLFLNKKASSSGEVRPPMAAEMLGHYTAEQLRAHYLGLGVGVRSVSFQPRPLNPAAAPGEGDPVLKEGNLLANVFNRLIRTCFYSLQTYFGGALPEGGISPGVRGESERAALEYERLMHRIELHSVMSLMDSYIRYANKALTAALKAAEGGGGDAAARAQALRDGFHMVRVAATLIHPIAPEGAEKVREYLGLSERMWDWRYIFRTLGELAGLDAGGGGDGAGERPPKLRWLEPKTDFFTKHPSQLAQAPDA
ncbi:MAG: class I tRNA ligase family protein, partial [Oscillospiraceae bacterium]|nr:class I tRNA ligase family protein [Oscillospiraceae bacterium]